MNKLKLDLDQLTVESFDTDTSGIARRGTVRAHSEICTPTQGQDTCANTCDTCNNTCYYSCGASCRGCTGGHTCFGTCAETCNTCPTNCQQESCVEFCP